MTRSAGRPSPHSASRRRLKPATACVAPAATSPKPVFDLLITGIDTTRSELTKTALRPAHEILRAQCQQCQAGPSWRAESGGYLRAQKLGLREFTALRSPLGSDDRASPLV